jgi:hypothetical protein
MKHTYKVAKRYHIETIPQAPIITLIATISKSHYVIVEIGLMKKYLDYNVCIIDVNGQTTGVPYETLNMPNLGQKTLSNCLEEIEERSNIL